jgi:membrane-associated protein
MTQTLLDWLIAVSPGVSLVVLLSLSALENIFPPVPADVAVALGVFLAQRTGRSTVLLGTLCWLANTASSVGMYLLARSYGPEFFGSGWGRHLVPRAALETLRGAYERHGMLGIFLSRFLPGIRAGVTPFAGVVGLAPLRALVPAALASAIWYALIVLAATALGLEWSAVRRLIDRANSLLGLAAVAATLALLVWLIMRSRRAPR